MDLAARRSEVSREIGLAKTKNGRGVRDREREREVKAHFEREARRLGLSDELAKDLANLLISDSVRTQEDLGGPSLKGSTALVVGGAGRTGQWFCRFLSNRGAEVRIWDPRGKLDGYRSLRSLDRAASDSDIVVIASPLGTARAELDAVLAASPRGLVFDVCSVKSHIAASLKKAAAKGILVSSIHPMFGPGACSPKGRNVIVCDCGSMEASERVVQLFSSAGAIIARTRLDEHDRLMAYVLGLPHLCTLLFARTIGSSGRTQAELRRVGGPSFERMRKMAEELSSESRRVYHDIQALNPNTEEVVTSMERVIKDLRHASLDADPSRFAEIMRSNRNYLEVD